MKLKVTCRISRRIGKDSYVAPPPPKPGEAPPRGRVYDIEAERAGKYADYFTFASSEDEATALAAFQARRAADDAAYAAKQVQAFSLADLARAVKQLIEQQQAPQQKGVAHG